MDLLNNGQNKLAVLILKYRLRLCDCLCSFDCPFQVRRVYVCEMDFGGSKVLAQTRSLLEAMVGELGISNSSAEVLC